MNSASCFPRRVRRVMLQPPFARDCDMRRSLLSLAAALVISAPAAAGDVWPQFRGLDAGVAEGKNLPVKWSAKENVAWSIEVPGRGWSSPVVVKGKIFLTTVERKGGFEDAKKGLYF